MDWAEDKLAMSTLIVVAGIVIVGLMAVWCGVTAAIWLGTFIYCQWFCDKAQINLPLRGE